MPEECSQPNVTREKNRAYVDELISAAFADLDQAEAIERLSTVGIVCGRLNDMAALARHPQLRRLQVDTHSGTVDVVAVAAIRSRPSESVLKVPAIGEYSLALRDEFS